MRQERSRTESCVADLRGINLKPASLLTSLALGFAFAACDGSASVETDQTIQHELKTATPAPNSAAVLGFEVPGAWSTTSGATLAQSSQHTEGAASLSVRPASLGYMALTSVPLSSLAAVSPTLAVDVMLPRNQPNPFWYGTAQIYLNCPSRAIHSQFLAQVELTGKPREAWTTLNFPVKNQTAAGLLRAGYSDLVITLVLNVPVPNSEPYYVDNLRFVPVSASGCTGLPNGTACNKGLCTVGDVCMGGACTGGSPLSCDDGLACTVDTCDPTLGCVHTGECPLPCGGPAGIACPDGEYCSKPMGTCEVADTPGVCKPLVPWGPACNENGALLCGCNNVTYSNECQAAYWGVNFKHTGRCIIPCDNGAGYVCPYGQYCAVPKGTCQGPETPGTCELVPETCPPDYVPVCGCDGQTYANACEASKMSVSIVSNGVCPPMGLL